jgi:hypothetical protein
MKQKALYTLIGIIHLVFGLGFVLLPDLVAALYGVSLDESGTLMARLLGAADLASALPLLGARTLPASPATRLISQKGALEWSLVAIILLVYSLLGALNFLGWMSVVLFAAIVYLFATDIVRQRDE